MAGFLFRLETVEGESAEPPTQSSAVPDWKPGHTIHIGTRTLTSWAVETTTPISHLCWSWRATSLGGEGGCPQQRQPPFLRPAAAITGGSPIEPQWRKQRRPMLLDVPKRPGDLT
jgi:hypothetical protein